jgi:hypothetical protein
MDVIDHGVWLSYKPSKLPEGAPPNALFARRGDVDWYDYVNETRPFRKGSLLLTVAPREENGPPIISAPTTDPTALFPAGHRVIELTGDHHHHDAADLINRYASKVIDLKTGEVFDAPAPEPALTDLTAIIARIEKLEKQNAP